jgi:hypothetical protein
MLEVALVLGLLAAMPVSSRAQGGPPLMTDDPDTPGPGHWEINVASIVETSRSATRIDAPRIDLNYGVGDRIQLKFEAPWTIVRSEDGPIQRGAGTAVAGVKWRFVGQEGKTIAWSLYPQLEFNIPHVSAGRAINEPGRRFLLPTEITIEAHHVELNAEVGRSFEESGHDSWLFGLSSEGHTTKRLELIGEFHGEHVSGGEPTEIFLNGGAREKLTDTLTLLVAAGATAQRVPDVGRRGYLYAGLQVHTRGPITASPSERPQESRLPLESRTRLFQPPADRRPTL